MAAGIGWIVDGGGSVQVIIVAAVAMGLLLGVWRWSHRNPVTADNVNDFPIPADRVLARPGAPGAGAGRMSGSE